MRYFIISVLLAIISFTAEGNAFADKPNIVFILTDDLDVRSIGKVGGLKTLLADQGITFKNHFVSNALCCPSRASILRGQYGHNTGVFVNTPPGGGFVKFHDAGHETSTVATWLKSAGYKTGMFGKYLNGYSSTFVPPGWDEWHVGHDNAYPQFDYDLAENGTLVHYGHAEDDYLQDVLSGKIVKFIHDHAGQPFFVWLATYSPHGPATFAARHAGAFPGAKAPRTATFNEADMSKQPPWIQSQPKMGPAEITFVDGLYRRRLRSMLAVMDTVEAIIGALVETGQLDNTYVVFTSDNGFHLGQHRLTHGKATQFEEDLRVPLIIRGPGVPAGQTVDAMTVNIDFAPTFADLADANTPAFVDGRSLVPLLDGTPPAQWRQAFLLEQGFAGRTGSGAEQGMDIDASFDAVPEVAYIRHQQPTFDGVRTKRWSYARMFDGERALYDLQADPVEHTNVAKTKPAVVADLNNLVDRLRLCSGQSCRDAEDNPW